MNERYEWRGNANSVEIEALHAECFAHRPGEVDWALRLGHHSLGWVCARRGEQLVGFVNVAWDGGSHAFLLDTMVSDAARANGVGRSLVAVARDGAADAGCEWLHVDFEAALGQFYFDACGFAPTAAGVIRLPS